MDTKGKAPGKKRLFGWLTGLAVLLLILVPVFYLWLLLVVDNNGVFTLTFSVVDLDLDGDQDVLVHNRRNPGEFEVFAGGALWINQGGLQGGQTGQLVYQHNDIEGGLASTTAELNGDGKPDVLVYDGNRLILGLNQGEPLWLEGGFFDTSALIAAPLAQREKFGLASQYAILVTGDVDNDGRVDALVLGCCGRAFKVKEADPDTPNFSWAWLNKTNDDGRVAGDVASLDVLEGTPVGDAALADVDGDSDLDLLLVRLKTRSGPAGMVLFNDGTGRFSDSGQQLDGGYSLAWGDLDNDGDPDILLGDVHGAKVWVNQGGAQAGEAGVFAGGENLPGAGQIRSVVLADMDHDGDLDALVVAKRRARLWLNDGQAGFVQTSQSFPCSQRQNLTTGDFNNDGWPDIFIATYDKTSRVWVNNGEGRFRTGIR